MPDKEQRQVTAPDLYDDGQLIGALRGALAEGSPATGRLGYCSDCGTYHPLGEHRFSSVDLAHLDADFPPWHAWLSDANRVYASRAIKPGTSSTCGECLDADTPAQMRELLRARTA